MAGEKAAAPRGPARRKQLDRARPAAWFLQSERRDSLNACPPRRHMRPQSPRRQPSRLFAAPKRRSRQASGFYASVFFTLADDTPTNGNVMATIGRK